MKFWLKLLIVFSFLSYSLLFFVGFTKAETRCDEVEENKKAECLSELVKEYETKVIELQGKQRTLASTIKVLDNQIILTEIQIIATEGQMKDLEKEIQRLSVKITQLNDVLADVSQILTARIEETYKRMLVTPVHFLFSAKGFADFLSRFEYLRSAQHHDRELLYSMEEARLNFDQQKSLKEQKQQELGVLQERFNTQKVLLGQQKASKQELLLVTKNDEKTFQNLLAKARAEFAAIQSILAGKGEETKIGEIKEGETIASIISGTSACSTGTHLHFEVVQNGNHSNPSGWLRSVDVDWDLCGWYGCDEPFSFSGSWNWPINGKPRVTQGYGMTAYARSGAYGGSSHTGIDIVSDDLVVKTVKEGMFYRGSIACGGGTLRYVKVEHKEGDLNTYYLHINYIK